MTVLARSEIEKYLRPKSEGGSEVLKEGTWTEEGLRGAAYDVRVASDYLILPNGHHYWDDGPKGYVCREASFSLEPGGVAFVSSVEVLQMPFDLAANIAPQFRRALDGILVMGGLLVDPGYEGRLHFQLANVGSKPFEIRPEETSVAAIQLLTVSGDASRGGTKIPRNDNLLLDLFHPEVKDEPLRPLAFFTLRSETEELKDDLMKGMTEVKFVKESTTQLIYFGLFVIFAALISIGAAAIITILGR